MQLNLPDAQQKLAVNGQKEKLIESQMEKMFCIWMYEWCKWCCEWRLSCYKRIIREKDAKEIYHNSTEAAQLLITKKADV